MSTKNEATNDNNDLTTDARPSPPRNNNEETKNEFKVEENEEFEEINEESDTYKKPNSRRFSKAQRNSSQTSYANVINISQCHSIQIGSNYTYYGNNTVKKNKHIAKTEAIKSLFTNEKRLTVEQLSFVSAHIDEGWRDIARVLNYSDGQIHQFYESNIFSGIKEVIYQFLLDWIQNEPEEATIGKLSRTLWENGQNDAVLRWSQNKTICI